MTLCKEECDYASCYCEENVYRLAERLAAETSQPEKIHAVFISNKNRKVPLFSQKSAKEKPYVIWDYHVVLLEETPTGPLIWDLDSTLSFPCPAETYFERTVVPGIHVDENYRRFFRVIPASAYLDNFSSDRSHMLQEDGSYSMPPPPWPAVFRSLSGDTLQKMITMEPDELPHYSTVLNEDGFRRKCCTKM